jgi:hypothetical protein
MYLTYDADPIPDTQKKWFKIAEWYDCKRKDSSITLFTLISSF